MRKEKKTIKIQEEIAITQGNKRIILEAGDKIRVLNEDLALSELQELVDSIDFKGLISKLRSFDIPVKSIDIVKIETRKGSPAIVCAASPSFPGQQLGVLSKTLSLAKVVTANSDILPNRRDGISWWAVWNMQMFGFAKVHTERIINSLYNFETKNWEFQ